MDGGFSTAQADALVNAVSVIAPVTIPAFTVLTGTW
jgi:hypothetical protein